MRFHSTSSASMTHEGSSTNLRLPKLAIPTFDGNILNWRQFWEQSSVSVHDRINLSNAEKLVYLQQSIKEGSAKPIIYKVSGEQYDEAIECLVARFDRPRLLHQTHVKTLLDTPSVHDGNGRELRRLHDISQQHIVPLRPWVKSHLPRLSLPSSS